VSGITPTSGGGQPIGEFLGKGQAAQVAYQVAEELETMNSPSQVPTQEQIQQILAKVQSELNAMKHPESTKAGLELTILQKELQNYCANPNANSWQALMNTCQGITNPPQNSAP
jgi:hypothetical protein